MYRIAISGSYGGRNLGDEAILEGILRELQDRNDIEVVVFSYNPEDTKKRHNVRAIAFREMHKDQMVEELKKLDLLILGGGGILFDGLAEELLRDVVWAKEMGIPVFVYAVSVGPLKSQTTKQLVVDVLNKVDVITVRENESKRLLNDYGVTKDIEVTADPSFLIQPSSFTKDMVKNAGINSETPIVAFSVREPGGAAPDLNIDQYHTMLANSADFIVERFDAQILFISMEPGPHRDLQHSHAVISKMLNGQKASVLKEEYTSSQILGLMKHVSFAVGMRLHFLIFAGCQFVPFIPLPYASKVKGFLEDLEMPSLPMAEWNAGKVCATIDRAWDTRKTIANKLKEKIPSLREKAKRTSALLFDFLKTIKPKKPKDHASSSTTNSK